MMLFALLPLAAGIAVHPPLQSVASVSAVSLFDDFIAKHPVAIHWLRERMQGNQ